MVYFGNTGGNVGRTLLPADPNLTDVLWHQPSNTEVRFLISATKV
jgi:hypothetical protein